MQAWIFFTLLAASLQSVRTAGQKSLTAVVNPLMATAVRYFYGLPFVLMYFFVLYSLRDGGGVDLSDVLGNGRFVLFALGAGLAQILATIALLRVFAYRNFAVGTSLAKTEAIQVAIFGAVLFSEHLKVAGWCAVMLGAVGTLVVSGAFTGSAGGVIRSKPAVAFGLAAGALFAFASLFVRQASLSLQLDPLFSASITLVFMVPVQALLCLTLLRRDWRREWGGLRTAQGAAWFVGLTSAVGSVGWFTAMSLQNPAVVKTLAQVEFLITLLITHYYFRERIARFEWLGMAAIIASVLLILLPAAR